MTLDALVLTAFRNEEWPVDELRPWLDDGTFPETVELPDDCADYGSPLYHDGSVGVVATGVGPTAAATTVDSLLASPAVDTSGALVVTAGIAGGPPARTTVGTTVVADTVVDWDRKHRVEDGGESSLRLLDYRPREYAYDLNDALVERVVAIADGVDLREGAADVRSRYPDAPPEPAVERGTTVAGGEFWHGRGAAEEVDWLCEQYDAAPYWTASTEDAGTAHALARRGALDRYCSVRAVSNFDRPPAGADAGESLHQWENGLAVAVGNVHAVAGAVVEDVRERPGEWRALF